MTEVTARKGKQALDRTDLFTAFKGYVAENITNREASLESMAGFVGVSKFALTRIVKKYDNSATPASFLWSERLRLAREFIIANPTVALKDVYPKFGFGSAQHFSRVYRDTFNETPSATQTRSKVI